eukprot:scaffold87212_cov42-Phaeocystis_antarctica.AAC.1
MGTDADLRSSGASYSSTTKRTRKSPTEVWWSAAIATVLPSAICQVPASARPSWSSNKRVPRGHPPYFGE